MYLLDTDHITLLARSGEEGERIRQRVLLAPEGEVSVSIVSYEEQVRGGLAQINRIGAVNQQASTTHDWRRTCVSTIRYRWYPSIRRW